MKARVVIAGALGVVVGAGVSLSVSGIVGKGESARSSVRAEAPPLESYDESRIHAELVRAHRAQAFDPDWAATTSAALTEALTPLAVADGVELAPVDCRSTSCVVTVRWSRYEDAKRGVRRYLPAKIRGCRTETTLPPPSDPEAPYDAEVVYDCHFGRARG